MPVDTVRQTPAGAFGVCERPRADRPAATAVGDELRVVGERGGRWCGGGRLEQEEVEAGVRRGLARQGVRFAREVP